MLSTCRWPQILCEVLCVSVFTKVCVSDMELSLWVLGKESLRDDLGLRTHAGTHAGINVWHVSGTKCLCLASSALKRITELPKSISAMSAMSESAVVSRVSGIAGTAGTPYVLSLSITIYHSGSLGQSEPCQCLLECRRPARRHPWTSAKAQHPENGLYTYTWIQCWYMLMSMICDEIMWYARLRFK